MNEQPELPLDKPSGNIVSGVQTMINAARQSGMKDSENAVLSLLESLWPQKTQITQLEIAVSEKWVGCHRYEIGVVQCTLDSTVRQIRQIIRNFRIHHKVPILSDSYGYFLPSTIDEAHEYIERTEREARSRAASSIETYRVMKKSLGISSNLFEKLDENPNPNPNNHDHPAN
jgi:hypothetical protein